MRHTMTDKNADEMTATCSVCGPVKMRKAGGGFQCEVAYRESRERNRAKTKETQTSEETAARHERKAAYMREYYQENKEKYVENTRRWRAENPERNRESSRDYYNRRKGDPEFREANREKTQRYYDSHKDDPGFREHVNERWRRNYHRRKEADDG